MTTTADGQDLAKRLRLQKLIGNAGALLQLDERGVLKPHGIGGHAREIIKAFIREFEAAAFIERSCNTGQGVGVKPLEWKERPWAARQWAASSAVGDYFAGESDGKFYWNKLMEPGNEVASIEAAKAAAQADFERRILSALAARIPEASVERHKCNCRDADADHNCTCVPVEQAGRSSAADEYYQRGYGLRRRVLDYLNSDAPKHTLRHGFSEWEAASGTKFATPPALLSPSGADLGGKVERLRQDRDAAIAERDEDIAALHATLAKPMDILRERAEAAESRLATAAKALTAIRNLTDSEGQKARTIAREALSSITPAAGEDATDA